MPHGKCHGDGAPLRHPEEWEATVTHELYDPTAVLLDCGCDQFGPVGLERGKRASFISAHQLAVAADIGCEDCSQPPSDTHLGHDNCSYAVRFLLSLWRGAGGVYRRS